MAKTTMKQYEKSGADRKADKSGGYKEGSKADQKADRAAVAKINGKSKKGGR